MFEVHYMIQRGTGTGFGLTPADKGTVDVSYFPEAILKVIEQRSRGGLAQGDRVILSRGFHPDEGYSATLYEIENSGPVPYCV